MIRTEHSCVQPAQFRTPQRLVRVHIPLDACSSTATGLSCRRATRASSKVGAQQLRRIIVHSLEHLQGTRTQKKWHYRSSRWFPKAAAYTQRWSHVAEGFRERNRARSESSTLMFARTDPLRTLPTCGCTHSSHRSPCGIGTPRCLWCEGAKCIRRKLHGC